MMNDSTPPPEELALEAATAAAEDSAVVEMPASPSDAVDSAPDLVEAVEGEAPVAEARAAEPPLADVPIAEAPAEGAVAAKPPKPPKPPVDPAVMEERRKRAQAAWDRVVAAKESGETVNGFVTAAVKGGVLVDVGGIRGFVPASQTRLDTGAAIESLVKKTIPLKVIDLDAARRRIVVSQRRAMDDDRRAKRSELIKSLAIGQKREATVVRLVDFGAFVDLGGVDGLIPMSELAFERVEKSSDVLSVGDKLTVEVIRIEDNGKKIALSRKNALPDPWRDHGDVLKQGATLEGTVVSKDRGRLQVEIAPGIIGSVRESDADPDQYEIGEKIEVSVRYVDRRTRRITLTTMFGAAAMPAQTSSGFAPLGVELGRRS